MALPNPEDIQRLIIRGYAERPHAAYLLLRIADAARAQAWIGRLATATREANRIADEQPAELDAYLARVPVLIGTAHPGWRREDSERVRGLRLTLAFTASGLERLGLPASTLEEFIPEFRQGMHEPHRSRVLGDVGDDAPERWRWGGPDRPVDLLCVVFAQQPGPLEDARLNSSLELAASGLERVETIRAELAAREPFGFADGISQPQIDGVSAASTFDLRSWSNRLPPGEFLLGHENAYGYLPVSPQVTQPPPQAAPLPPVLGHPGRWDFGCNGSFIALRQLAQDVPAFRQYVAAQAAAAAGDEHGDEDLVRARMVGRWPGGAPLELAPERDDPSLASENDFAYAAEDRSGARCPIGAHIRRSNPRDGLTDEAIHLDAQGAMERVNHHRIIRRGRAYSRPGPDAETGLVFLAFNANLERQFEFVQQTWVNSAHFDGLHGERDPLISGNLPGAGGMTLSRQTVADRMRPLATFVGVRGGAYFFMPGLNALAYLGTLRVGAQ